jgi:hypothetical protein
LPIIRFVIHHSSSARYLPARCLVSLSFEPLRHLPVCQPTVIRFIRCPPMILLLLFAGLSSVIAFI